MSAKQAGGLPARGAGPLRAILFDLDGTLLDTAADITSALNSALADQQLGSFSEAQVREMIGRGVPTLIERALARLAAAQRSVDLARLLERGEYQARVYPGVAQGLSALFARGLKLAVVTNKRKQAAVSLLARLGLGEWIQVVVGGDSCAFRKPRPEPLLQACEALKVSAGQALMVGDSETDVLAARAAGMAIVCVPYGYNEGADPRALACDVLLESLGDLPALLSATA
ncbi:MAG TPA: phosphoglycolate phosphatase [Steroidobacteraceae bacterium]